MHKSDMAAELGDRLNYNASRDIKMWITRVSSPTPKLLVGIGRYSSSLDSLFAFLSFIERSVGGNLLDMLGPGRNTEQPSMINSTNCHNTPDDHVIPYIMQFPPGSRDSCGGSPVCGLDWKVMHHEKGMARRVVGEC